MKGVIPFILLFIGLASAQNLEVSGDLFPSYNEKLSKSISEVPRPSTVGPEPQPPTRRTIYAGDVFIKRNPNLYPQETLEDLKRLYKESLKFSHRDRQDTRVGKFYIPMPKPVGDLSSEGEARYKRKLEDFMPVKNKEGSGEKQEIVMTMKQTMMTEPTTATTPTTTFTTTTDTPIATEIPTSSPPQAPTPFIKTEPVVQSQALSSSFESQTVNSKEDYDKKYFVPEVKTETSKHFNRKMKNVRIKKIQEEVQEIKKPERFGATEECKETCDDEPDHRNGRICGLTVKKVKDERIIKRWSWYRNQCERRCHLAERSSSKHCLLQDIHKKRLKKKYLRPKYHIKQDEMDSSSVE